MWRSDIRHSTYAWGRRRRSSLVVGIVGPTAVGKSDLGLALGQRLNGEIVSADSRQIYRYLDIGTAKPTLAERLLVPHHIVDVAQPDEVFTLASFQESAYRAIDSILSRGKLPLLVGGTGLYVKSVVEGLAIPRVAPCPELRRELERRALDEGSERLHQDLQRCDPVAAARIDARNVRRVVRALEICISTGQAATQLQTASAPPYDFLMIGLTCARQTLYKRIDERVERQFMAGLVAETKRALELGFSPDLPSMSGLGHRQASLYLRGLLDLAAAIELDKHDTHRFARQQYNWFRLADKRINWLATDELQWTGVVERAIQLVEAA